MRINNQPPVNSSTPPTSPVVRADSAASSPGATHINLSNSQSVSAQDYGVVPSFELQTLTAVLAEIPPVRPDVIAETIRRLQAGDLQNRNALAQTASAILGE